MVIHSLCMYDQESPIRCVYSSLMLFVYVNCTTHPTLAYGFHLIGNLDGIQEHDFLA